MSKKKSEKDVWARRIRSLRRTLQVTQEELARRLGISFVTVNRWENGHPPSKMAMQLVEKLEGEI